MTRTAEQLLSDALTLSESERAELAAKLLDTLDPESDEGYAQAWEAEIRTRVEELDSGKVQAVPWQTAREMIRQGDADEGDAKAR
jgi:putative addiction module component (TIGR02574 family)